MKHRFNAQYTFPVSPTVFEIIKKNTAKDDELLRHAYIS
jgi:hypothetical protein